MLMKYKDLLDLRGVQEGLGKKGGPKNDERSLEVIENKSLEKATFRHILRFL
jgi:hypothetical protein